ncbi:MAG: hypothetical protein LBU34_13200 [Planctomycetaceae bacterium]|jgi:hypothetical protein|nr:hypothetical protein [Planctomycetaceae bacterium]
MLSKRIPTIVLFLLASTFFATTNFAQKVSDAAPKRIPATEFIIFPYDAIPLEIDSGVWGDLADADAVMKDIYDCGFNATVFIPAKHIKSALPYNLAVILRDTRANPYFPEKADETIQTILNEITTPEERKAIYASYVKDEPHSSLLPRLSLWSKAFKKQGILPYINLFPECTSATNWGAKDYEEYVDLFVAHCQPQCLSYDNYSLNDTKLKAELREDQFYSNLEIIRKKSFQYNIPFWNVILGNTIFHYAEPSETTFRIQVYSTLAYGGKGIGYYTYYTRPVGNYHLAPIDQFGYRTKTWNAMRSVNLQIHSLAPVYCQLKSVNVFHVQNVPKNCQGKDSTLHLKSISEGPFLVGEFVDPKGNPYVMVVNKNLQSSVEFNVAFKKEGRIVLISPYNKGKMPFEGEQCWLAPGAGVLLTVE